MLTVADRFLHATPGKTIALHHVVGTSNLIAEVLTKDPDRAVGHVSVVITGGLYLLVIEFTQHRRRVAFHHQELDRRHVVLLLPSIRLGEDRFLRVGFLFEE